MGRAFSTRMRVQAAILVQEAHRGHWGTERKKDSVSTLTLEEKIVQNMLTIGNEKLAS